MKLSSAIADTTSHADPGPVADRILALDAVENFNCGVYSPHPVSVRNLRRTAVVIHEEASIKSNIPKDDRADHCSGAITEHCFGIRFRSTATRLHVRNSYDGHIDNQQAICRIAPNSDPVFVIKTSPAE